MKILVLSDSHFYLPSMRQYVEVIQPDAIVHLGDLYQDGRELSEAYPGIPMRQVPGNCDQFRCAPELPRVLVDTLFGVRLFMTHGHEHGVKSGTARLIADARRRRAQAALYGHTHIPDCRRLEDGLWVLNPGSSGAFGTAGVMEIDDGAISACYILEQKDLEGKI